MQQYETRTSGPQQSANTCKHRNSDQGMPETARNSMHACTRPPREGGGLLQSSIRTHLGVGQQLKQLVRWHGHLHL